MPLLLVIITCTRVFDPCCLALPSVFVVLLPSAEQAQPVPVHLLIAKGPCLQPATISVATPPPLGWAGHSLAFIVKVESAGSHVMRKILCVCEWWVTGD